MKKLTFIFTLLFAFMFSTNAIATNPLMDNYTPSNDRIINSNTFELGQYTGITIDYDRIGTSSQINFSEGCIINSEESCTITAELSVGWVVGGSVSVSVTADTCMEAWNMIKTFAKKVGINLLT